MARDHLAKYLFAASAPSICAHRQALVFEHNFQDEHIHPIVLDAFTRVILPRYPLSLQRLVTYPEDRSTGPRLSSHIAERILAPILGNKLPGDLLCLFLQRH